jgi:hypothetical protein
MANFYSLENQLRGDVPPRAPGNEALGGRKRLYRATIALDAPITKPGTTGTVIANGDTISIARVPAGMRFVVGRITSSVSLGTSTVAVGIAGTADKYKAAAVFTAVDTPTAFGKAAAMANAALGADEEVIATVAVADLPNTAGAKLIIDLEFVAP